MWGEDLLLSTVLLSTVLLSTEDEKSHPHEQRGQSLPGGDSRLRQLLTRSLEWVIGNRLT